MNCSQTRAKLMDYQSDRLDPQATFEVENHLSDCEQCQGFARELSLFEAIMQDEKNHQPSPSLTNRIMNQIAQEPKAIIHLPQRRIPAFAAVAAIALLVLIGVFGGIKLGDQITSGLVNTPARQAEISSLLNELDHEPLEQMLFNLNNSEQ